MFPSSAQEAARQLVQAVTDAQAKLTGVLVAQAGDETPVDVPGSYLSSSPSASGLMARTGTLCAFLSIADDEGFDLAALQEIVSDASDGLAVVKKPADQRGTLVWPHSTP